MKKAFTKKDEYFYSRPSEYKKKIDAFFDRNDFIPSNNKIKENDDEINKSNDEKKFTIVNEKLLNCMDKLKSFYRTNIKDLQSKNNKSGLKEKNVNIEDLGKRMENLEKLIACHDKIRITVYGTYNAGKSSTLNGFIGKNLLQVDDEQCTGKPILIRYLKKDEKPKIYKAELKTVKDYDKFSHYAFIEKGKALAEGEEAVKNFINSQNVSIFKKKFPEIKDKTDDFFILKTPIKILDELGLSEEIKNNIEFLDTPGLNTGLWKNEGDLLSKLIEQTFIYFFIIDPSIGGADTNAFKNILENTMLKTLNNISIINDSKTFPYLFICNKCDDETIEFKRENCNKSINLILSTQNENFDIIKYSAHKRKNILNKMNEYTPENFIEKVENEFFNVLYFNGKTFFDYLDSYIPKDFKNNFNGEMNHELEPDQSIKNKIVEILKKKNYEISDKNEVILSKLSGYLLFCNNNFRNLKIADNEMMDEIKDKIKIKINTAYEHIKNGYKKEVLTALQFIENFIKIGIIPDSSQNRSKEKEIERAKKILADITKTFEINNIPEFLNNFRDEMIEKIESRYELKDNYDNYEEVLKNKENFLNERKNKLCSQEIPGMFEKIKDGVKKAIEDYYKDICDENGIDYYFKDGKMIIKIDPSTKDTTLKVTGSLALAALGVGIVNFVGTTALTEAVLGGFTLGSAVFFPGEFALTAFVTFAAGGEGLGAALACMATPIGWFGLLAAGSIAAIGGIYLAASNFSERKKNYYNNSIESIKEKFFSFYNSYEKKCIKNYKSMKEKYAEEAASFLNMCHYPVELNEEQRQSLLNLFDSLQKDINNILK